MTSQQVQDYIYTINFSMSSEDLLPSRDGEPINNDDSGAPAKPDLKDQNRPRVSSLLWEERLERAVLLLFLLLKKWKLRCHYDEFSMVISTDQSMKTHSKILAQARDSAFDGYEDFCLGNPGCRYNDFFCDDTDLFKEFHFTVISIQDLLKERELTFNAALLIELVERLNTEDVRESVDKEKSEKKDVTTTGEVLQKLRQVISEGRTGPTWYAKFKRRSQCGPSNNDEAALGGEAASTSTVERALFKHAPTEERDPFSDTEYPLIDRQNPYLNTGDPNPFQDPIDPLAELNASVLKRFPVEGPNSWRVRRSKARAWQRDYIEKYGK